VRARLPDRARSDACIAWAAITGSAARDAEDEWSDIDLAFGGRRDAAIEDVLRDWTAWIGTELRAIHPWDLADELGRALGVATSAFIEEVRAHDAGLADRLAATLRS
jgi:hypothetical protein